MYGDELMVEKQDFKYGYTYVYFIVESLNFQAFWHTHNSSIMSMPKCSKIQAFYYEINVCVPIFEVLFFHQHGKILQKHPCHRFIYIGSTF